jgi:hypothetical protein
VSLARLLSRCLFHENDEVVLETTRALGNLTRSRDVTRFLVNSRADEALLLLLDHRNSEIVSAATGALVNISADPIWRQCYISPESHQQVEKPNPFDACLGVLRRSALKDLRLSALLCQVIYNLLLEDDADEDKKTQAQAQVLSRASSSSSPSPSSSSSTSAYASKSRARAPLEEMIPVNLAGTLSELVECAEDLAETFASLTGTGTGATRGRGRGEEKETEMGLLGAMRHVFHAVPELQNTSENMRKYTDFAKIGRAVLGSLKKV